MLHAYTKDGTVVSVGDLPRTARRQDTGQWVTPPDGNWPPPLAAACGWLPVTETARPTDTATDWTPTYTLAGSVVAQTWTARPWTAEEVAAQAAGVQRDADRLAVRAILDTINANLDEARAAKVAAQAVLDAVAPTNVAQAWTQIKAVARVVKDTDNALIGVAQGVKDLAKYVKDM